jgi:hypothetical protein
MALNYDFCILQADIVGAQLICFSGETQILPRYNKVLPRYPKVIPAYYEVLPTYSIVLPMNSKVAKIGLKWRF